MDRRIAPFRWMRTRRLAWGSVGACEGAERQVEKCADKEVVRRHDHCALSRTRRASGASEVRAISSPLRNSADVASMHECGGPPDVAAECHHDTWAETIATSERVYAWAKTRAFSNVKFASIAAPCIGVAQDSFARRFDAMPGDSCATVRACDAADRRIDFVFRIGFLGLKQVRGTRAANQRMSATSVPSRDGLFACGLRVGPTLFARWRAFDWCRLHDGPGMTGY